MQTLWAKSNQIGFIYKQYCQSIFRYGLEFIHLTKTKLEDYNVRQNILVKRSIGLSKYVRTTRLLHCLKIESIQDLYRKHKIFLLNQIKMNKLTSTLFCTLKEMYDKKTITKDQNSIFKQIEELNKETNFE
jgi:hypothetical protein